MKDGTEELSLEEIENLLYDIHHACNVDTGWTDAGEICDITKTGIPFILAGIFVVSVVVAIILINKRKKKKK